MNVTKPIKNVFLNMRNRNILKVRVIAGNCFDVGRSHRQKKKYVYIYVCDKQINFFIPYIP